MNPRLDDLIEGGAEVGRAGLAPRLTGRDSEEARASLLKPPSRPQVCSSPRMPDSPPSNNPQHASTDNSLRKERAKSDDEVERRMDRASDMADEVVERARGEADEVLRVARDVENVSPAQAKAHGAADATIRQQRADADQKLADERSERTRALARSLRSSGS